MIRRALLATRELEPGGPLLAAAERLGLEPIAVAALAFREGREAPSLAGRIARGGFDWIALTSPRAAAALARAVAGGTPLPPRARVAVTGEGTAAALRESGIAADLVAPAAGASALARAIAEKEPEPGRKILFLRGNLALRDLPDGLAAAGHDVTEIEVYETEPSAFDPALLREVLRAERLAASIVFSPSAAEAVRDRLTAEEVVRWLASPVVTPGATTAGALRRMGAARVVAADGPGETDLARALGALWNDAGGARGAARGGNRE